MENLKDEIIIKIIIKILFILFKNTFDYQPKLNPIDAIQAIKKN